MALKKQYGLIIPNKSKQAISKKPSLFDDDSDDENKNHIDPQEKLDTWKSKVKKKTHMQIQKVLDDDPTVYEYDSIYDDMKKEKQVKNDTKSGDRKPKYIGALMKSAELRKKEYEQRIEKQIQKEREAEGDEFKDKEAFVTSAYKKKMLEMQEQEEKERLQKALEERMDVTKQNDLSGFYRHFLKQTTGEEKIPSAENEVKCEKHSDTAEGANNSHDDKHSAELDRAKQAISELKQSTNRKRDSSDKEIIHGKQRSHESDRGHSDGKHKRHKHKRKYHDSYSQETSKNKHKKYSSSEEESDFQKESRNRDDRSKKGHEHRRKHESNHSHSNKKHKKKSRKSKRRDSSSD